MIIEKAKAANVPVISCMGTGNKLDASKFEITDISKTSVCPLAKAVRTELRKRGIRKVKVYSKEKPIKCAEGAECRPGSGRPVPEVFPLCPVLRGFSLPARLCGIFWKSRQKTIDTRRLAGSKKIKE